MSRPRTNMAVAERLQQARERAGFTRKSDAAKAVDVQPVTYRAWETGQNGVGVADAKRLADAFGTSVEWLLYGTGSGHVDDFASRGGSGPQIAAKLTLHSFGSVDTVPPASSRSIDMSRKPPRWWPQVINLPRTTTILALGFLAGNLLFLPVIAWLGDMVAERYADAVMLVASMFKDGMLLILGFYFGRNQASEGQDGGSVSLSADYRERRSSARSDR